MGGVAGKLPDAAERFIQTIEHLVQARDHLREFICRDSGEALVVDRASLRNLEVERGADGSRKGSLIEILDHTRTRMGSRMLHDWLVRPSIDLEEIGDRHRAVAELVDSAELLQDLRCELPSPCI